MEPSGPIPESAYGVGLLLFPRGNQKKDPVPSRLNHPRREGLAASTPSINAQPHMNSVWFGFPRLPARGIEVRKRMISESYRHVLYDSDHHTRPASSRRALQVCRSVLLW